MSEFMNTIDLLGDEETAKVIIERKLTEFNDNICESIGERAFSSCSALTSVDLPNATSIGSYAFNQCSTLTSVDLPNVTSIRDQAFNSCKALTSIDLPKVTSIDDHAFGSCFALTSIDLPKVTSIGNSAFGGCSNLNVIILGGQSVCTLKNTSAFNNTPFAAGKAGGTVYVPQALIEQYQNATNWSTLYAAGTCNFVAIEGSEYE